MMKRMTVFTAALACGFAGSAIAPAGAIDFKKLPSAEIQKLLNAPARNLSVMRLHVGCTLYEDANAKGQSWRYEADSSFKYNGDDVYTAKRNLSSSRRGKVSSVKCDWQQGKRECGAFVYLGANQTGKGSFVYGQSGLANLSAEFNDKVASIAILCDVD